MKKNCRHTKAWAAGKRTCILCWRIPVQWEGSARAASENARQWLREDGFLPGGPLPRINPPGSPVLPPIMTIPPTAPAEKTYTLTLTENEMARVIQALTIDGETLRALAAEYEGDPSTNYAAALAEASEALRTRFAETVKPERDPIAHVPTDERWAIEQRNKL